MIYLIQVDYKDQSLLKIGYTEDLEERMKTYRTHNPGVRLLQTREGDREIESFLHKCFDEFHYENEWFRWNQKIITEFNRPIGDIISSSIIIKKIKDLLKPLSLENFRKKYFEKYGEKPSEYSERSYLKLFEELENYIDSLRCPDLPDIYDEDTKYLFHVPVPLISEEVYLTLDNLLGRQRLSENPWKNTANLYIKYQLDEITHEEFMKNLNRKINKTNRLLDAYNTTSIVNKHDLAENYDKVAKTYNYKDDYVAVNRHGGKDLIPVFNNLMLVAEERAYEVQQIDYKNRFTVFSALDEIQPDREYSGELEYFVREFNTYTTFVDRMKYLCRLEPVIDSEIFDKLLTRIPGEFENYIKALGIAKIGGLGFQKSKIIDEFQKIVGDFELEKTLKDKILEQFSIGKKYLKSKIKADLGNIYKELGYSKTAKATDLEKWFIIKPTKVLNNESGSREHGFEILERKEESEGL